MRVAPAGGYDCERVKACCVVAGLPVIDSGIGRLRRRRAPRATSPHRRLSRRARRTDGPAAPGWPRAPPRQGHGGIPHQALWLHRRHGRSARGDRFHLRDHLMEAAPVRALWRLDRASWPTWSSGTRSSTSPTRRPGKRHVFTSWRSGALFSRVMPRRCAAATSPTAAAAVAIGSSATLPTRQAAACSFASQDRTAERAPPANGLTPPPASMAISSTSSP